ncbi:MAG: glycosyltransferase, partial [Gammaproteobacteria bacterium]|nr:glycosyltransferase [Gammaproteobacteria bacterium]
YARYFPRTANSENPTPADAFRFIYSRSAHRNISQLLSEQQPDIAHLHIYYGKLTASILPPLTDSGVPVVQTLHEYKLLCPVYTCVRDERICEDCGGKQFWKATAHRCNRGSLVRSLASSIESYTSNLLGNRDRIDHFIGVSHFMTEKMRSIGIPEDKLSTVHNFVDTSRHEAARAEGDYLLYFGRLEATKGLFTLLEALRETPGLRCIIAGSGPALDSLRATAERYGLTNVEFPGFISGEKLHDLVRGSICTILPSEWYENCPMSVLESLALGRPVIGARIGGIPELINDGIDGLLVEPGNAAQLAAALCELGENPAAAARMGAAGREKVQREFSPDVHYAKIQAVYDRVLG